MSLDIVTTAFALTSFLALVMSWAVLPHGAATHTPAAVIDLTSVIGEEAAVELKAA